MVPFGHGISRIVGCQFQPNGSVGVDDGRVVVMGGGQCTDGLNENHRFREGVQRDFSGEAMVFDVPHATKLGQARLAQLELNFPAMKPVVQAA